MVSGLARIEMGMEHKLGLMEQDMKVSGKVIEHAVKENFGILMEIYTMVNGRMIKLMDKEPTFM
jgi:hypothetical protein